MMAVIDPTGVEQWALRKAITIAKSRGALTIYAYLCAHSTTKCGDPERLREVDIRRHQLWLDEILSEFSDAGITIEPIIDWNADWRDAICIAAERAKIDVVIKRASGNPDSLANSDRRLIRGLDGSALFLVKHDPVAPVKNVLVAVDLNTTDSSHLALNNAIVLLGQRIRENDSEIQLHSVSAYENANQFSHPPDVAKILNITRAQARVCRGSAAEVIPEQANKIGADLVIIGNVGRRGLSGVTIGNTAEKILTDIKADVLILVQEMRRDRTAL